MTMIPSDVVTAQAPWSRVPGPDEVEVVEDLCRFGVPLLARRHRPSRRRGVRSTPPNGPWHATDRFEEGHVLVARRRPSHRSMRLHGVRLLSGPPRGSNPDHQHRPDHDPR
jgi:hypothetical protein